MSEFTSLLKVRLRTKATEFSLVIVACTDEQADSRESLSLSHTHTNRRKVLFVNKT
jgi:hypothetical protein